MKYKGRIVLAILAVACLGSLSACAEGDDDDDFGRDTLPRVAVSLVD
jgi:hypothetical protein